MADALAQRASAKGKSVSRLPARRGAHVVPQDAGGTGARNVAPVRGAPGDA